MQTSLVCSNETQDCRVPSNTKILRISKCTLLQQEIGAQSLQDTKSMIFWFVKSALLENWYQSSLRKLRFSTASLLDRETCIFCRIRLF